jgi:hypothetical protein
MDESQDLEPKIFIPCPPKDIKKRANRYKKLKNHLTKIETEDT